MKLRMWIVELDQYGWTDRKAFMDDPLHIPRKGEFIDGTYEHDPSGTVDLVQWHITQGEIKVVYVFVKKDEQ